MTPTSPSRDAQQDVPQHESEPYRGIHPGGRTRLLSWPVLAWGLWDWGSLPKIGRASCRERV